MSTVQSQRKTKSQAKAAPAETAQPVVQAVADAHTVSSQNVTVSSSTVEVSVAPAAAPAPAVAASKRQTKKGKAATTAEVAAVPAVEATAQPVVEVAAAPAQPVVEVPAVEATSGNEQPSVETEDQVEGSYSSYDEVVKALNDVDREIAVLNRKRVQLSKFGYKMYNQLSKQLRKKSKVDGRSAKRPVSGFNKPVAVPAPFCAYLKLDSAVELPRTSVTALLYKHIKENNLLDPADKRKVIASPELRTLLCMKEDENLRFENFQHFVSRVYKASLPQLTSEQGSSSSSE